MEKRCGFTLKTALRLDALPRGERATSRVCGSGVGELPEPLQRAGRLQLSGPAVQVPSEYRAAGCVVCRRRLLSPYVVRAASRGRWVLVCGAEGNGLGW